MDKIIKNTSVIWLSLLLYFAAIEVIVLFTDPKLFLSSEFIINRLIFLSLFIFSYFIKDKVQPKTWTLLTIIPIYAALTFLYKETATLNEPFHPTIDNGLMVLDESLFGFQPALEFSKNWSSALFSELMFFGYFSYYVMPLVIFFLLFNQSVEKIKSFGFMLITSFLIYYLFFILVPAVGPQFYFEAPLNQIEAKGIFGKIIKIIQENGEVPTAAFPSSHVGIALIMLIWLKFNANKYLKYFLPNVLLLIFATVYIKAHYAVDIIAGILSAPIVYFISYQLYQKISIQNADRN